MHLCVHTQSTHTHTHMHVYNKQQTIPLSQNQLDSCLLSFAHSEGPGIIAYCLGSQQNTQNALDVHQLSQYNIPLPAMPMKIM